MRGIAQKLSRVVLDPCWAFSIPFNFKHPGLENRRFGKWNRPFFVRLLQLSGPFIAMIFGFEGGASCYLARDILKTKNLHYNQRIQLIRHSTPYTSTYSSDWKSHGGEVMSWFFILIFLCLLSAFSVFVLLI